MNIKTFFTIILFFGAGLTVGYVGHNFFSADLLSKNIDTSGQNKSYQVRQIDHYTYISPLLECEVAEGLVDGRKESFHHDLEEYVLKMKKERGLAELAVYFRDLNNGPSFGINISDEFFPASLLKVPVMMAYYRWVEEDPELLRMKIQYIEPKDLGFVPTIVPKKELVPGQFYTIEELIHQMIIYSDNQALYLLSGQLPRKYLEDLFSMLGVRDDVLINPNAKLTVKEYASFFRVLFNSSYLSREYSEKALSLLAETDYHDALPAGVPSGVAVAHKFGETGAIDVESQFHDCGIVYFPEHPYLACIMTRGRDAEQLKLGIRDISHFIYEKIDEQY